MSLSNEEKQNLIKTYAINAKDTGSPEVQIALWTVEINNLIEHFKTHAKDNHSRLGLMKKVARRRHLLDYLKKKDESRYQNIIAKLNIRR
ncbi:MAG: 30S ribosomal protein S15 [Alphaproteobacteria bacterium]|nr:30S ribosomal protein S15 [Alphaproteobacteria bacterium]MBQ9235303.1 30S ribosomal protein S15 [Alphaproteobacteria bacterium]